MASLASCAVRQEVSLRPDGSGSVAVRVVLREGFYDYLGEMNAEAGALGAPVGADVFDLKRIQESVRSFPGVDLVGARTPNPRTLELDLSFKDVAAVARTANPAGSTPLFTFQRTGTRRLFRVHLDLPNYARIAPLIPGSENPLLEVLGPQAEQPYTEAEYLDVIAFMMGDHAPGWIRESTLEVRVQVPGRVVAQQGGIPVQGGVLFRIPLLDVLLLERPLVYSIEFETG